MSTFQLYGKVGANFVGGEASGDAPAIDYLSDTIRFTLHTATYSPAIDTNEASPTRRTSCPRRAATRRTASPSAARPSCTRQVQTTTFDMDDTTVTWTASGGTLTFQYAVFHDDTVTVGPPIKPLIGYIDCGAQAITTGNTFLVTTGASGLFTATVTLMGFVYAAPMDALAVSTATDLYHVTVTDTLVLHALELSQTTDLGDASEEVLRFGFYTGVTGGTGGTAATRDAIQPHRHHRSDGGHPHEQLERLDRGHAQGGSRLEHPHPVPTDLDAGDAPTRRLR